MFFLRERERGVKKCAKLVSRLHRKSSEINHLIYSYQNSITVNEELAQLSNMFKVLVNIHEEFKQIDKEYTNNIWFDNIDQKVFLLQIQSA